MNSWNLWSNEIFAALNSLKFFSFPWKGWNYSTQILYNVTKDKEAKMWNEIAWYNIREVSWESRDESRFFCFLGETFFIFILLKKGYFEKDKWNIIILFFFTNFICTLTKCNFQLVIIIIFNFKLVTRILEVLILIFHK